VGKEGSGAGHCHRPFKPPRIFDREATGGRAEPQADAFASGAVDGDELEAAVEAVGYDTETIARREDVLEDVASVYELDFRPYGGTLIQEDGNEEGTTEADAW
jgi:hypothetical protein